MAIEPIKNDVDHSAALDRIEALWNAGPGSPDFFELDALATLVARYEETRWPVEGASPLEALKFAMEQQGWGQSDLAGILGSRSRASEVMSGKRSLTLEQIRKVSARWRVPVALLIGELGSEAA